MELLKFIAVIIIGGIAVVVLIIVLLRINLFFMFRHIQKQIDQIEHITGRLKKTEEVLKTVPSNKLLEEDKPKEESVEDIDLSMVVQRFAKRKEDEVIKYQLQKDKSEIQSWIMELQDKLADIERYSNFMPIQLWPERYRILLNVTRDKTKELLQEAREVLKTI